jgi:hypothetical protein
VRRVIYHPDFDADAIRLGGIAVVQRVIAPLVDALERTPNLDAFGLLSVSTGIRYAIINAAEGLPSLLVTFVVDEDADVIMRSVDRREVLL